MKKYGKDIDSESLWDRLAQGYPDRIVNDYHRHRFTVINALIPEELYQNNSVILDFGCGDAILFDQFLIKGSQITGMDISAEMITLAKQRLSRGNHNLDLVSIGGVSELARLEADSLDAILSFNVLAYLTDDEEDLFYKQAYKLLREGGYLIVTHSNELFDMYALNQYTYEFFNRHLVVDDSLKSSLKDLIRNSSENESTTTYNIRENPLSYRFKLLRYGFVEKKQEFINLHAAPPPLLSEDKSYPDTLSWNSENRWKLMFICSSFGSLSVRE